MTRAIIYARTSSDDSERDSLSSQVDECRRYCEDKGYRIVDELREDVRGVSGSDMFAPALREAVKLAEQGRYDVLVIRDVTRFTRDKVKGIISEYELSQHNIAIEFVWNPLPNDEYGSLIKDLLYWASQKEKENVVKRMRNGRMTRIESGSVMVHAHPAYGYEVRKENKLFVAYLQPNEAEIVRLIYHLFVAEGLSIRGVTKELNDRKYVTRTGHKWHPGAVYRILTQHAYKGEYRYGNGENHRIIPIEPIISESLFDQAQAKLSENANEQGRKAIYEYLLAKRITCACGFSMAAKARDKGARLYYSCNRYQQGEATDQCIAYVRAEQTDEIVWNWLENILKDKDLLREKIESVLERHEARAEPLRVTQANIERLIEAKQKQVKRLIDVIANTENAPDSIMADIKLRESEIAGLETELEDVKHKLLNVDIQYEMRELYQGNLEIWGDMWTVINEDLEGPLNFERKRQYIERFNVAVTITRDDLGTWLHVESDLGEVVSKLSQNVHLLRQKRYTLIIYDTLALETR